VLKVEEKDSKDSCTFSQLYTSFQLIAERSFLKFSIFFTEKSLTVINLGGTIGFGLPDKKNIGKWSEILIVKMPETSFLLLQFVIMWSIRVAVFEVQRVGFIIN
jgi:hypothetical protein